MGLNRCPKLTDEGLRLFLGSCTKLTSLALLEAHRLSDSSMQALIEVGRMGRGGVMHLIASDRGSPSPSPSPSP